MDKITEQYKIINGNSLEVLDTFEENSVDAIITDPPYELGFMGKSWDASGIAYNVELWKKALRVLKPGGYLLAFGGTRTFHRIACAIEDAGFEIRDCIMWLYGCLSEDTEVLTKNGFKRFHKITEDDIIRIYDIKNRIFKWEKPKRWFVYKVDKDTCYHIKSRFTDQIVSKNHRCLIEQNGKLIFRFAEELCGMERVPFLSYNIPYLQKSEGNVLFSELLWQGEDLASELLCERQRKKEFQEEYENGQESSLERRNNLSKKERELCFSKYQVCKVSARVYDNGEKRWLCNGTSTFSSASNKETIIENGMCSSYQPQCGGQSSREFNVVCNEQRTQTLRKWKTYKTTLAKIEPIEYSGILFCPNVSTGCFVARRNGKVFITGNSGFPKSHNIGLDIDKLQGCPDRGHRIAVANRFHPDGTLEPNGENLPKYEGKTEEGKKWDGWGTCLKPAYEPIIMARKPIEETVAKNCLKYGVGGLNIDACRIPLKGDETIATNVAFKEQKQSEGWGTKRCITEQTEQGRFPANIIHDGSEETTKGMPIGGQNGSIAKPYDINNRVYGEYGQCNTFEAYQDNGSAARYFYCAKASSKDRDEGLNGFDVVNTGELQGGRKDGTAGSIMKNADGSTRVNPYAGTGAPKKNIHPTVKPTELMQYLVRLVAPKGATILDIFNGSGSTGKAVAFENREREMNYSYIGIELDPEYCKISEARIDYVLNKYKYDILDEQEDNKKKGQMSLFDDFE